MVTVESKDDEIRNLHIQDARLHAFQSVDKCVVSFTSYRIYSPDCDSSQQSYLSAVLSIRQFIFQKFC